MNGTSKTDGNPAFLFYPDAWLSEPGLRVCSFSARGIWIELLCHMWRSPERGVLLLSNGKPMTMKDLARLLGGRPKEVEAAVLELESKGVLDVREKDRALVSRRMIREHLLKAVRSEAGEKGAIAKWSGQGQATKKKCKKPPPLETLPNPEQWHKTYLRIAANIAKRHRAVSVPEQGSNQEREWQDTLRCLCAIDMYSLDDVQQVFRWLFTSDDPQAAFWREQVASIGNLRVKKKGDPRTKFDKIAELALAAPQTSGGVALSDEQRERFARIREQCKEQDS
jgi:hypothetical protein